MSWRRQNIHLIDQTSLWDEWRLRRLAGIHEISCHDDLAHMFAEGINADTSKRRLVAPGENNHQMDTEKQLDDWRLWRLAVVDDIVISSCGCRRLRRNESTPI